jgi:Protein of unknown function (DUF3313)
MHITPVQITRRRLRTLIALALLATTCLIAPPLPAAGSPPEEWDGLVRVDKGQVDHVYLLPDASFAGYKRIRLDPVQIAFDKNWKPNQSERSTSRRLNDSDIEAIKSTLAEEFRKVFSDQLTEAGYALVDQDGEDVLRVSGAIVNLYITAPERPSAGRSRTYVASNGHMSGVVELRDSVTGQLLARAVDNVSGRDIGTFQIANSVTNLGDARVALNSWARALVKALGEAGEHPRPKA